MDLSVVIPIRNELSNLQPLHLELTEILEALGRSYEIVYVDDGSDDGSREQLRAIQAEDPHVHLILFRRNFGQTAALSAGFAATAGEVVVTMDGDLQNDPADIPSLLAKLDEGHDLVSGWRKDRQDKFLPRRLPSLMANAIIRVATNVRIHDYGCMMKVYRGEVARDLRLYGEMHRFIPAIAWDRGASVAELVVNHRPRISGTSKYGLSRAARVVFDLLTVKFLSRFATRPLHVIGMAGLALAAPGGLMMAWLAFQKLIMGQSIGGRPMLLISVMLIVTGVQLVTMGLLAEMLVRTYHESQAKPTYVVAEDLPATHRDAGQVSEGTAVAGRA